MGVKPNTCEVYEVVVARDPETGKVVKRILAPTKMFQRW